MRRRSCSRTRLHASPSAFPRVFRTCVAAVKSWSILCLDRHPPGRRTQERRGRPPRGGDEHRHDEHRAAWRRYEKPTVRKQRARSMSVVWPWAMRRRTAILSESLDLYMSLVGHRTNR